MTENETTDGRTKVPDWLKERFEDVTSEAEWAAYKKLADTIKNNSFIYMTVADLSDETLDYAATVYSDDFYSIDPWGQQMRLDDIRDWIVALIEGGVISVSPKIKLETISPIKLIKGFVSYFRALGYADERIIMLANLALKNALGNEDALVFDSSFNDDE